MDAHALPIRDLAYVIIAAITGGLVAWRLRQPLIIGYVLAGIVISPLTPGPSVTNLETIEIFAEIGVVLLMFSVGLEFSLRELLKASWVAFVGGPLGILVSIFLGLGAGSLLGWTPAQGVVLGAVISVASTMVLTRQLMDRGQLRTSAGRIMVAITLVEDFAVIIFVVLIPGIATLETGHFWGLLRAIGRAAMILVPVLFLASKTIPTLLKHVARTQSRELFFLIVLSICLGTAALTSGIGLSLALGAFAAGLIISESDYAQEAIAQLFPIRDAFVAVFFVSMGMLVDPGTLFSNLPVLGVMIALIVPGKFLVWLGVVRSFGYSLRTAVPVGVGLTQIGEFSFVLVQVARSAGIIGSELYNATLAASLITILLNAGLFRILPAVVSRMGAGSKSTPGIQRSEQPEGMRGHVIICGFGRIGSAIGYALGTFGVEYIVIEADPDVLAAVRQRGIVSIYGDCSHSHLLERAGARHAALLIVTIADRERSILTIRNARRLNGNLPVMVRARRREDYPYLMDAGATEVVQPEMEASATFIRHACGHYLMLPDSQIRVYLRSFRDAMESAQRSVERPTQTVPEVREVPVANSALAGRSLRDMRLREVFGVTVVAIKKAAGESLTNPPADTVVEPNDRLRVLGRSDEIDAFAAQCGLSQDNGAEQ